MDKLLEFVRGSKNFSGFCMNGNYDININLFVILFNHFKNTGDNLLDVHAELTHLMWDINNDEECYYDERRFIEMKSYLKIGYRMRFFSHNDCVLMWEKIQEYRNNNDIFYKRQQDIDRLKACSYTAKKEVKEYIFNKYGRECLCCGSKEDVHLDHVIPIKKGGKNDISNLQPLCKKCNSKKGVKIIDYRIKKITS